MKKLIAVVLAGGGATRFWPFTTSKVLFPFMDKTLFEYSVKEMLPPEVSDVVIISNSGNKSALESVRLNKPTLTILQPQPLGMADAILAAASAIKDAELLIIIADDLILPSPLRTVVSRGRKGDVFAALPAWKPKEYFSGGYLRIDGDRVLGLIEKPGIGKEPSPFVATSGHYFKNSNKLLLELSRTKSDTDDVYERTITMLAIREQIVYVPFSGTFSSLKFPWHVLDCMQSILSHRAKQHRGVNIEIKPHVIIEGDVYIGDNVKIFEGSKIVGPCYIGSNSVIGNNCMIRESHIGHSCVVGFNTDITRSYIGNNCWFHSNYVGDSVLEGDISMGGGAALANLRLDDGQIYTAVKGIRTATGRNKLGSMIGAGVRLGVNVSVMPGVKIGAGTFVGSGVCLGSDVPEKSFVQLSEHSYTIGANTHNGLTPARDEFKNCL